MSEFGKKPPAKGKDEPSAATADDANLGVLMPAYAIGATDAAENARIARELAGDEEAIAELAAFSRLAETMLYSPPPVAAPPRWPAAYARP